MGVSGAFLLAIQQLSAPVFRRVLVRALGLAALTFAALAVGVQWALVQWGLADTPWIGTVIQFLGGFATLGLAWVLFPAVSTMMVELFVEDVTEATELAHYPDDPPGRSPEFVSGLLSSVWFVAVAIGVNVLAIPIYLFLLLFPPLLSVAFYGINGYLLGREYFELAAHRHLDPAEARLLRHDNRWRIWGAGAGIAAAAMVHVFKSVLPDDGAVD